MEIGTELWLQLANDDQQAFADIYRVLFERLYNYGRKFTSAETLIEDAAQEVLLSIWTKRRSLSSIQYPVTYFFTAFRNSLFGLLKTEVRFTGGEEAAAEPEFAVDHFIISRETDEQTRVSIEKALAALTSRQREAIFLRFYEGLSYEELAIMMNITVKGGYKLVARALEQLRETLNFSGCLVLALLGGRFL